MPLMPFLTKLFSWSTFTWERGQRLALPFGTEEDRSLSGWSLSQDLEVSEGEETGKRDFPGTMRLKGYASVRVWWGCPSIPLFPHPSLQTP